MPGKLSKSKKLSEEKSVNDSASDTIGDDDPTEDEIVEDETIIDDEPIGDAGAELKDKYNYQRILVDDLICVHPDNRITSEFMTEYEVADVISIRAKQIENDGVVFTDTMGITDPIKLAYKEILDKKCPLDIKRHLTDKIYERWHVNEMSINPDVVSFIK